MFLNYFFCQVVVVIRPPKWHITVWRLAKVAIFITNVDAENQTLINHKCVCGALNRHFCQTPVMPSFFFLGRCFPLHCCVVVRWLVAILLFFCLALCGLKNCKCATKSVGYFFFICPILGTIVIKNLWFAVPMSGCVRGIPFSPLPAIIISQFFNLSRPMLFDSQNFVNDCAL